MEVELTPVVCSQGSVIENSRGKRTLVANLKHLSMFIYGQKFKYEDLRVARLLFKKGDYLFMFDLKSEYHHIDIAPIHHTYLGNGDELVWILVIEWWILCITPLALCEVKAISALHCC